MFKKPKIDDSESLRYGFLAGAGEAGYCLFVALGMILINQSVGKHANEVSLFLLMLLFFVFSAAFCALLFFAYPLYLALEKRYAESLMTVCTSLVAMAIVGIMFLMLTAIL